MYKALSSWLSQLQTALRRQTYTNTVITTKKLTSRIHVPQAVMSVEIQCHSAVVAIAMFRTDDDRQTDGRNTVA